MQPYEGIDYTKSAGFAKNKLWVKFSIHKHFPTASYLSRPKRGVFLNYEYSIPQILLY